MSFKDHFSGHADTYAAARPTYPTALFGWLAALCPARELAWDVGCGNGQASRALAAHFARVHATDPSAEQIAQAAPAPRIAFAVEPAERCSLPDASADLVTVAQALHWFDLPAFYAQVRRVLKPDGVCAAWSYGLSRVAPDVDAVFMTLYDEVLGPYWPPERRHVESGYRTLDFPFDEVADVPAFEMRCDWTLAQYLAYLKSWSASQKHLRATGVDAVDAIASQLAAAWGAPARARSVRWPLALRVGRTAP